MSILIKGMEMPQSCSVCPLMTTVPFDFDEYCTQTGEYADQYSRPDDCPLVEVPPHGRLIDVINALCVTAVFEKGEEDG